MNYKPVFIYYILVSTLCNHIIDVLYLLSDWGPELISYSLTDTDQDFSFPEKKVGSFQIKSFLHKPKQQRNKNIKS